MAGTVVADTLKDGAANTLPMTTAIKGSAKAWVNFNGSSGAIRSSFNVSSVTVMGGGVYHVNFTSSLANSNYAALASCAGIGGAQLVRVDGLAVDKVIIQGLNSSFGVADSQIVSAAAFSN